MPVDAHGRVAGLRAVYAAGDLTVARIRHGAAAAGQGRAAAGAILAGLGLLMRPRPYRPARRESLLAGGTRRVLGLSGGPSASGSSDPAWSWDGASLLVRELAAPAAIAEVAPALG